MENLEYIYGWVQEIDLWKYCVKMLYGSGGSETDPLAEFCEQHFEIKVHL